MVIRTVWSILLLERMMEKRLTGACQEFCPSREVKLRRRERLVHKLESDKVESSLMPLR